MKKRFFLTTFMLAWYLSKKCLAHFYNVIKTNNLTQKIKMKKRLRILFILLFSFHQLSAQNFDINLLKEIRFNRNTELDNGFEKISDSVLPLCLTVPTVLTSVAFFTRNKNLKHKGFYMASSIAGNFLLVTAIKYSVHRTRPYVTYPELQNGVFPNDPSFPSGHTSNAFALSTSLSLSFPKWYVTVPSFVWASSVGYSRLHLGVHYPTDVFAGALIGSGCAYLAHKINKRLRRVKN